MDFEWVFWGMFCCSHCQQTDRKDKQPSSWIFVYVNNYEMAGAGLFGLRISTATETATNFQIRNTPLYIILYYHTYIIILILYRYYYVILSYLYFDIIFCRELAIFNFLQSLQVG